MASVRESIASECKIDTLKFWATGVSASRQRMLVGHGGIGIEGERFEDLGEGARRESLQAELFEDEYMKLDSIFADGKRVSFTHPLFGVRQVRIENISYRAGPRDMVDATIIVVEDGEREIALAPAVLNLGNEAQRWSGAVSNLAAETAALAADGFSILDVVTTDVALAFNAARDAFSGVVELAQAAEAAVEELAASYGDFAAATNDIINFFEDAGGVYATIADLAHESIAIAQDVVRSVSVLDYAPWNTMQVRAPVLIGAVVREYLGADTEDNINLLMQYNPTLIDAGMIPAGIELVIPVV